MSGIIWRVIVRCTAKVLALVDCRPREVPPADDDWYLNLMWLDRRKCLLLTHAATLFPVFVADVRKAELSDLSVWVRRHVVEALVDEGLPANVLGDLGTDARIARTASRRVLGCMNQTALEIEYAVARDGGLGRTDAMKLNRWLRRSLHGSNDRRDFARPLDLVHARLAAPRGRAPI